MFYKESSSIIDRHGHWRFAVEAVDRRLARAYRPDKLGFVEAASLASPAGLDESTVATLLAEYGDLLDAYDSVRCCDTEQDPKSGRCIENDCDLALAPVGSEHRHRILRAPVRIPLDPAAASSCNVMISYRHSTGQSVATEIYHHLNSQGKRPFLDDPALVAGTPWEPVFLGAASRADNLLAIITSDYWDSPYCRLEIAHSARSGRRIIPVSCGGRLDPPEFPWLVTLTSVRERLDGTGTTESFLLDLDVQLEAPVVVDNRWEGCAYLLKNSSNQRLRELTSSLGFLAGINQRQNHDEIVASIAAAVYSEPNRLQQLIASLAPR